LFTFLWRAKKSNKRNPPNDEESPLNPMAAVARAKTRSMQGRTGSIGFDKINHARQVDRLRAAQTVSPRDPRHPPGSGPHRNGLATPDRKGFLADRLPGKNPGYEKHNENECLTVFLCASAGNMFFEACNFCGVQVMAEIPIPT